VKSDIRLYADFTMKKLLTLFVLLALVLVAAAPYKPALTVDDCKCSTPTFTVTGADPSATYELEGQNGKKFTEHFEVDLPSPDADGMISFPYGFLDSGSWIVELHVYGRKGAPTNRVLDSVTFDVSQ